MKTIYMSVISTMLLVSVLGACAPKETAVAPPEAVAKRVEPVKEGWEVEWEKLVAAAKREGTVSIYEMWGPQARIELTRAFKERFGIDLEFTAFGTSSQMAPKLVRERSAGVYLADIIGSGFSALLLESKPAGILAPIEPMLVLPEVRDPKYWIGGRLFDDKEKLIKPLSADFKRVLARNTELVKEGEIKSYQDLLDPKWKGKIASDDPTITGGGISWVTQMVRLWGLDKTRDYLRQFIRQEPVISRDTRLTVEGLARGKYAINVGTNPAVLREFQKIGAPVATVPVKEGGYMSSGGGNIALPAGQLPHPNAAKVFINWLLTKEGQTVFTKGYLRPSARTDVSKEGFEESVPLPGEPISVVDDEEGLMLKDQLAGMAKEMFAPLMK